MGRISTIQTASVITQPVDAVEPLTLIEKLKQEALKPTVYRLDYFDGDALAGGTC